MQRSRASRLLASSLTPGRPALLGTPREGTRFGQNLQAAVRQRHLVLPAALTAALYPLARDRPQSALFVDFGPEGTPRLARACSGEDQPLEGKLGLRPRMAAAQHV